MGSPSVAVTNPSKAIWEAKICLLSEDSFNYLENEAEKILVSYNEQCVSKVWTWSVKLFFLWGIPFKLAMLIFSSDDQFKNRISVMLIIRNVSSKLFTQLNYSENNCILCTINAGKSSIMLSLWKYANWYRFC